MALNVQPLTINYSFLANRRQGSDKVSAVALDTALATIAGKLNEIIAAVNVTLRDDNTLADGTVDARHLSQDAMEQISAMIDAKVTPP